uniref:Integrase catalytic domain-containing protein n=1 Tax=Vitis vinifera TaxID=29760 RepID=A5BQC1_VITVI|nr:hypothetical protein VITISV_008301 [Vitis vinifera]
MSRIKWRHCRGVASNGVVAGEGATSTVKQPLRVTCDLYHKFGTNAKRSRKVLKIDTLVGDCYDNSMDQPSIENHKVQDDKGLPEPFKASTSPGKRRETNSLGPNGKDANFVWDPGGIQHEVGVWFNLLNSKSTSHEVPLPSSLFSIQTLRTMFISVGGRDEEFLKVWMLCDGFDAIPWKFLTPGSDVWGCCTVPNVSGTRWFVSFIDDSTPVTWLYLIKQKYDVSSVFPIFHSKVKNQFGVTIKGFRSDNAHDYFNQVLSPYFQKEGIIHESSYAQSGLSQESESPNPHVVPIQELKSQPPSQNSESLTKVYSTRKAHILDLLQAHEFEPALEKKVIPQLGDDSATWFAAAKMEAWAAKFCSSFRSYEIFTQLDAVVFKRP